MAQAFNQSNFYTGGSPQAPMAPENGFLKYLEQGGQAVASGLSGSAGNPLLGLGMAGLSLLDSSNKNDQADKAYQAQKAQYEAQLGVNRDMQQQQQKNQAVSDAYTGSNFATQTQDEIRNPYAKYLASVAK